MLLFFVLLLKGQTFPFNYMHDLLDRQNGKISLNRFFFYYLTWHRGYHERLRNVTAFTMLLRRILVPYHSFAPFLIIGLLQLAITWYKIGHAGGQAHYYSRTGTSKQRQVKLHWFRSLCLMSHCGNNNELALQHGRFCTT